MSFSQGHGRFRVGCRATLPLSAQGGAGPSAYEMRAPASKRESDVVVAQCLMILLNSGSLGISAGVRSEQNWAGLQIGRPVLLLCGACPAAAETLAH